MNQQNGSFRALEENFPTFLFKRGIHGIQLLTTFEDVFGFRGARMV